MALTPSRERPRARWGDSGVVSDSFLMAASSSSNTFVCHLRNKLSRSETAGPAPSTLGCREGAFGGGMELMVTTGNQTKTQTNKPQQKQPELKPKCTLVEWDCNGKCNQ